MYSLAPLRPKRRKTWLPSVKKGRFSSKKVSNAVRFTTAGSTSTWPKSGLRAPTSVIPLETPYLKSRPAPPKKREPSFQGFPAFAGATDSARPDT